jgi:hypothetical protein
VAALAREEPTVLSVGDGSAGLELPGQSEDGNGSGADLSQTGPFCRNFRMGEVSNDAVGRL